MDQDNLDKEGDPPFTLHIGMLFSAICRLALVFCLGGLGLGKKLCLSLAFFHLELT